MLSGLFHVFNNYKDPVTNRSKRVTLVSLQKNMSLRLFFAGHQRQEERSYWRDVPGV